MSTNTPDQQITIPVGGDAANNPLAFTDMIADVETRLVSRYTSEADRTARRPVPVEGELSYLADVNRNEVFNGSVYVSQYTPSLFTAVNRSADAAAIVSSTVLVNDTTLVSALPTAGTFHWESIIFYDSSIVADFKVAYTVPAGALMRWAGQGPSTAIAAGSVGDGQFGSANASGSALAYGGGGVGTVLMLILKGSVTMGGTAGNLQTQYAQNTSDATSTTVRARSRLEVWRVS